MKRTLTSLVAIVLISVVTSSVALAKTMTQSITFSKPSVVNGKVVKKGDYVAVFDDQTNELTIFKGKKAIAKAPARLEEKTGGKQTFALFRADGDQNVLVTVAFKNSQVTILNNETKTATAP